MKITALAFLIGLLTGTPAAKAHVILPAIIGDNMVLQQQSNVLLWGGSTKPGTLFISTSWDHKKMTVHTGPDGNWRISIATPAAGGPYEISFTNGETTTVKNILIGEVWFCGGQSNMEMPVRGYRNQPVQNSTDILADADNPQIHFIKIKRAPSIVPLDTCGGSWEVSDAKTVKNFSAVAYEYGRYLQQKLKVPVGLVLSCWGGTKVETWMDKNMLQPFPDIRLPDTLNPKAGDNQPPTALFNGMIAPVAGYGIKGFIWYQGESNRNAPDRYLQLFPAMVAGWRERWKMGELPFYYVQIAPYDYKDSILGGARVRDAQLKAMHMIPSSGMAVTLDIGKEKYIHPPDKTTVAKRLAYWSLAKTYHKEGLPFSGPVYSSMAIHGNKITVQFEYAADGLTSNGRELENFEIAGTDKIFHPAKANILYPAGTIEIWSNEVKEPVAVRYAFKNWVVGDLYNTEGLPASSFRTDDF
jgi:sialate O-acetylesterase